MSRPMALGLILLVLFLTSQSDWKPPKEAQDESEAKGSKADLHREEIKEKIIVDLTAHNKRLESENLKLRAMVSNVQNSLRDCGCVSAFNSTASLLEIESGSQAEPKGVDELEKEEVELLGGSASSASEQSGKSRLERVRMGHALAGRVHQEAEGEVEALTVSKREASLGGGESWLQPEAGRGYGEEQALLGEAGSREATNDWKA
eukprot:TRINITY_DN16302_c0_g1_i1.p1 TRINITY_DN16302_c0_g1~~TRINITY_DN16302_c0_g1_i1.p1  ORF type:complete len:205 (-),score=33.76 TRINITY_DN16302_c0_g1_i1:191-805(-)